MPGTKSVYQPMTNSYDFESMIRWRITLAELRESNKDESYTVKTGEHILTGVPISVC